jgi:cysteinyl-tRNA synthetase
MDFALWKTAKKGEPSWPSPWGAGRPGWHIECSAMNLQDLGEQIDIHGGGEDVIFPHHENEIAQSESFTGRTPFVRYWLHNALMKPPAGDEKMTRSLGNFVSLADALARYDPDAIRIFYLSAHYRTPLRWIEEAVQSASRGLERLRTALANAEDAIARSSDQEDAGLSQAAAAARSAFEAAMDDDFNTPQALAALYLLAAEINKVGDMVVKGAGGGRAGLWVATDTLRELARVLGLALARPGLRDDLIPALRTLLEEARREAPDLFAGGAAEDDADALITTLLAGRQRARERRAYALADRVRARLADMDIVVEDLPGGARWRPAGPAPEVARAGDGRGSPTPS